MFDTLESLIKVIIEFDTNQLALRDREKGCNSN